jgi:hypothetical protein
MWLVVCACFVCMPACCFGQGSVLKHVCNGGFVMYLCICARMQLVVCVCVFCVHACLLFWARLVRKHAPGGVCARALCACVRVCMSAVSCLLIKDAQMLL